MATGVPRRLGLDRFERTKLPRRWTGGAPILVLVVALSGCGRDVVADSAALDRLLIPAIEFASLRDPAPTTLAISGLETEWEAFRDRWRGLYRDDPFWVSGFDEIDSLLADADESLDEGEPMFIALEDLVDMRMLLFEIRDAHGIEYLLDPLHEFREPLAEAVRLTADREAGSLSETDVVQLGQLLSELQAIWLDAETAEFEPGRYGFTAAEADEIEDLYGSVSYQLSVLETAVNGGNSAEICPAVRTVEHRFEQLYHRFGDFAVATPPVDSTP